MYRKLIEKYIRSYFTLKAMILSKIRLLLSRLIVSRTIEWLFVYYGGMMWRWIIIRALNFHSNQPVVDALSNLHIVIDF
jgi:hypothetical protein